MCGIAGIFNLDERPDVTELAVRRAMSSMALRGPDDQGFFSAPGVALGHRRLAIIDLTAGKQPMRDEATGCVLVYNGEVYNFREIRQALEAEGVVFKTWSDTEVLLQAYVKWGPACLERCSGMFALAVFDPRCPSLMLARDRLGVKPLFYSLDRDQLCFASGMNAMLYLRNRDPEPDLAVISHYLSTIRTTLDRRTLIRGIHALQPGEYVVIRRNTPAASPVRYWSIPVLAPDEKEQPAKEDALTQFRVLMSQAVNEQLVSDVPLGGFLSGGLDSCVIAALASQLTGGRFHAYSVGYDREGFNEWPFVREAARHYGMQCREIHLQSADYAADWRFLIREKGLPLSTYNEPCIYRLARALKHEYTVALSGEGADEVCGGYVMPHFSAWDYDRARRAAPRSGERLSMVDRAMRRLYRTTWLPDHTDHHFRLNSWIAPDAKQRLFKPETWAALNGDEAMLSFYRDLYHRVDRCSTLDKHLHIHARVNLEGLLFRVDSSTMAASIEARVPFTDHRLAEYLFQLPDHYKYIWRDEQARQRAELLNIAEIDRDRLLISKTLLREAFRDHVPQTILDRRKMSFPVPVLDWIGSDLSGTVADALRASPLMQRYFDQGALEHLLATANQHASAMALWPLANLCLWERQIGLKA